MGRPGTLADFGEVNVGVRVSYGTDFLADLRDNLRMDVAGDKTIESAEVHDNGVIVTFADGKFAFYRAALLRSVESRMLREALEALSIGFRETLILRELEGFSYKEIAEVMNVPIGTVMSSLARGRAQLRETLLAVRDKEVQRGLRR